MNLSIEELATIICSLTPEAREKLNSIVDARFGVDPNAQFIVRIASDEARAAAISSLYKSTSKIEAIKAVRNATGLGLGEAKHVVENGQLRAKNSQSAHELADRINRAWSELVNIADPEFVLATAEPCDESTASR